MKYRILHNNPLEFYDTTANLVGSIAANGSNLKITSNSGVIELGNTATDIQVGTTGTSMNWSFLGGATIGAAGSGVISMGQSGDTLNMNVSGVTYQWPASLVRYTDISGANNKINISTQVPGSVVLTLPNKPVVGQLQLTDSVPSSNSTTGTLVVGGGIGATGNIYAQSAGAIAWGVVANTNGYQMSMSVNDTLGSLALGWGTSASPSAFMLMSASGGKNQIYTNARDFRINTSNFGDALYINAASNGSVLLSTTTVVTNTTISTSNSTGALVVRGGLGVTGNVFSDSVSLPFATHTSSMLWANTASSNTLIDSFDVTSYGSAKYLLQITNATDYQTNELLVLNVGNDVKFAEYAIICSNNSVTSLGTFYTTLSSNTAQVYFNPNVSNNKITFSKTSLKT